MKTESLTFTRFIAAISVVIFHYGIDVYPFSTDSLNLFFTHSNTFVSYFFFLSGFVMFIAYNSQFDEKKFSRKDYYIKRFARIYPLYLFSLLFYISIVLYFNYSMFEKKDLLFNFFLIQSWFKESALTLNYPGWSLSVELFFYASFPFLMLLIKRLNLKSNLFLYLIAWILSQTLSITFINNHFNPLIHINTFWGGILLAKILTIYNDYLKSKIKIARWIFIFSLIGLFLLIGTNNILSPYLHDGMLVPIFALIVFGIIYSEFNYLSSPILVRLGEISYGIYILQYPTTFLARYINDKSSNYFFETPQSEFYFYLLILLILSTVTYYLIEIPLKKYIIKISHFITSAKPH